MTAKVINDWIGDELPGARVWAEQNPDPCSPYCIVIKWRGISHRIEFDPRKLALADPGFHRDHMILHRVADAVREIRAARRARLSPLDWMANHPFIACFLVWLTLVGIIVAVAQLGRMLR